MKLLITNFYTAEKHIFVITGTLRDVTGRGVLIDNIQW